MDAGNVNAASRFYIEAALAAVWRQLGEAKASQLEKIRIDIVLCGLRLQFTEQMYTNNISCNISLATSDHLERQLTATRKRYLQSI